MILPIISLSLVWFLIGLLTTFLTCSPPKTEHLNINGEYDYNYEYYYRLIFSVVLWPVALIIRIIRFIIYLLIALYIGFKEEIKYK